MKNVIIRKALIKDINGFLDEIEKALKFCKDTQIFISEELFKRLLHTYRNNLIWSEYVLESFHYGNKVEDAYIFWIIKNNETKTFQIRLVHNSTEFLQLTHFYCKGILYHHYLNGMKKILIISSD